MSRDPEPIGSILDGFLERLGMARPADTSRILGEWAELAGEPWAERSRPVSVNAGELLVEVADGASASLLRYETSRLLERLDAAVGKGLVTTVRIRVARRR